MHLIDTHCHLSHIKKTDIPAVIERAKNANIEKLITVSCTLDEVGECLPISDEYDFIWTTVGIHPTQLSGNIEHELEKVFEYAKNEQKIVAIGEIGLDYYHDTSEHKLQAEYFIGQLNISKQLNKPAIIHCRGGKNPGENEQAFIDMIQILERENFNNGVVHCFSGNKVEAEKLLDMGLMISFTNIISYEQNEELREVLRDIPLDRVMLETDSPYISKEPSDVASIAKTVADIKDVPVEEVTRITTANAERFFGI
ncbi:TatD family hydrolase [Candidatus Peregrinibacteria bacterium]|nr:TatD family hydrolase [Candidatus Peregrinibacteria bacterium]